MSNDQRETLEDRLAKRRNLRNRRFLKKDAVDESEITVIHQNPTTQSLDRLPSKRVANQSPSTTNTSSEPAKASSLSATTKISDQPASKQSFTKENYSFPDEKASSAPVLSQEKKSQPVENKEEKQAAKNPSADNDKPVTTRETFTEPKSIILPPLSPERPKETSPNPQDKPIASKNTVISMSPVSNTTDKSPPIVPKTRVYSTPQQTFNQTQSPPFDYSSSNPESTTNKQEEKYFRYPFFRAKPMVRTSSEQLLSASKSKHTALNASFAQQNSLALPYLFNKRVIEKEFSRGVSLDCEETQAKTVWD